MFPSNSAMWIRQSMLNYALYYFVLMVTRIGSVTSGNCYRPDLEMVSEINGNLAVMIDRKLTDICLVDQNAKFHCRKMIVDI